MSDKHRAYGNWNGQQLRQAEATANRFLEQNSSEIAEPMRIKVRYLENLIQRISLKTTSFEDRLEYLARISEIDGLIQDDADGFFGLASQPAVARILATVPKK